ncbi:MAG TPA: hypothetical protein VEG40_02335 [Gaiellaceae bacterium]|nr:hypothetical protein [Gaiellaceae bacterium]
MKLSPELIELRVSLLRNLRRPLGPEDGDEAFDRHILLAVRVHRTAGLNARAADREGQGWRRYFDDYFPPGRNSDADAHFLWVNWRTRLLKHESPVGITHGQESLHWYPLDGGGFCVNLESMWDDFEYSVNRFLEDLAADKRRRGVVLRRWRERSWTVRKITLYPSERLFPSETLYPGTMNVSAANEAHLSTATSMTSLRPRSK